MQTNNNLVLGALLASLLVVGGVLVLLLWLLSRGNHIVQMVLGICLVFFAVAVFLGVLSLGLIFLMPKSHPSLERIALWTVNLLYPLAQRLCGIFGISSEALAQSLISANNRLVLHKAKPCQPRELLLLLPHCLQLNACPHKLDGFAQGCHSCGRCQLGELLDLQAQYGIGLALATGGTLARQVIAQMKPSCVVAVACERDLLSGIMETKPLSVYGVLNERPHGPCINTKVSLAQIEEAIKLFLQREV